jgi:3-methyladenine DNA glycosylase/8-oxoguanine DNA glycosylase
LVADRGGSRVALQSLERIETVAVVAQFGPYMPHFRSLIAWPTPREILRAGEKYLDEVCRLGYRTPSILAFCRDVAEGRFDSESLDTVASDPNVNSDDLMVQLRSIRGIGPSSARYRLGFLGRHDRLSIDSAAIAHVAQTHTHGRKPTPKRIERIYAPYGRWKTWFIGVKTG